VACEAIAEVLGRTGADEPDRRLQGGRARTGAVQKLGGVWGSAPNERRLEACCWGAKVDGGILETVP
jgi:hypothetical protein